MEYTNLGRTGLSVSRLCLGTMNFGPQTSEEDAHEIMDAALDAGVNFFDTANVYGWHKGKGLTEQIIGRWFAKGAQRRERTVIATKLYGSMSDRRNDGRLSKLNIRRACEASLRRLQTDYIDLYQMHHVDRDAPWEEIWEGMQVLVQQGKVLYVGSSNFAGWHIAQAQESAKARHFMGLVSEQCKYSLMERRVEMDVLPACEGYGLGVLPWSPLSAGLLGGILRKEKEGRAASDNVQRSLDEHRDQIEAYEALCDKLGEHPADVGLAWLLAQPAVTAPIIGPRTMEQFTGSLRALEIRLEDAFLDDLDAIFPRIGPAPEAFAW